MSEQQLLKVIDLEISFLQGSDYHSVIHNISFSLNKNEVLGIVGESGSGKSVCCLSLLGLLPAGISRIEHGEVRFEGESMDIQNQKGLRKIRGLDFGVVFQEPMSSLNPSARCGDQVAEVLLNHGQCSKSEVRAKVTDLFKQVKLPDPELVFRKYPHEVSGGQKQRVMIAMAIACNPKVLIADEPTTALDVTVQKDIINLLKELQASHHMSILFISHDLSLVSEIADRVLVMYRGRIVENGNVKEVFKNPQHPYTRALIGSRPSLEIRQKRLPTIHDFMSESIPKDVYSNKERAAYQKKIYSRPPLLEVRDLQKSFFTRMGLFRPDREFKALSGVSFKLYEGETLGLVGEFGCGKTTLGNCILQLEDISGGEILYKGQDITKLKSKALRSLRRDIQIIFQDPYSSLNPRLTIGEAIMEPMKVHGLYRSSSGRKEKVMEILARVGLEQEHFSRYPHQFSGGQRQRVGVARAIAMQPKLIVCDESVSALDISIQAQVLNLLNELKENFGFTYIFISHDLSVVKYMSDQLLVMNSGKIEEFGDADKVYRNPQSDYTQKLIDAIPKGL